MTEREGRDSRAALEDKTNCWASGQEREKEKLQSKSERRHSQLDREAY